MKKQDIPQILLGKKDIDIIRNFCTKVPAWGKSFYMDDRTKEMHQANYFMGKLGELAFHKYVGKEKEFFEHNNAQIRNFLKCKKKGDGGVDLIGLPIDVKTSKFKKYKFDMYKQTHDESYLYKNFYVPIKEFKPWKFYVKVYFFDVDLANIDKANQITAYIGGYSSGSAFADCIDDYGKPAKVSKLSEMGKISDLPIDEFQTTNLKLNQLASLTLSDTSQLFKCINRKTT